MIGVIWCFSMLVKVKRRMSLSLHNTLSGTKQPFTPIDPSIVRMYVCGITVYDYCHIGHARMMVAFDVLYRHLLHLGYNVRYIRNITDIDDKIIARSIENGESWQALTERFIEAMHTDFAELNILKPDAQPKATEYIAEMIQLIETLIEKGHAYPAGNGDVYYSVNSFNEYGKLSGKKPEELRSGERVEVNTDKNDPLDFVLWKSAKPGEPSWTSPWGDGRPGWHIECSAMSEKMLGKHFDIHGGGLDLQFPHHENEIAQSEAANGCCMANHWVHNGFVRVDDEKMSKSLGNFFTVRDVLQKYAGEVIRFFIVSSQYRSPLNYSDESLSATKNALDRLYGSLRGVIIEANDKHSEVLALSESLALYSERFNAAMNDDLNTPIAVSILHELAQVVNKSKAIGNENEALQAALLLRGLADRLGILQRDPEDYFKSVVRGGGPSDDEISALVEARIQARVEKDWAKADEIRDELKSLGIVIEDGSDGSLWRREN